MSVRPLNIQNTKLNAKNTKSFSYVGSKFQYGKEFLNIGNNLEKRHFELYIEPFAGTLGSLFHNLETVSADKYIINDGNSVIINFYKQVKENLEEVIEKYVALESEFERIVDKRIKEQYKTDNIRSKDKDKAQNILNYYVAVRKYYNEYKELDANKASMFLFLMRHCNNSIYQENKKGEFTSSFNFVPKINVERIVNTMRNQNLFFNNNEVVFESVDVFELIEKYNNHDTFIYLDPPYLSETQRFYSQNESLTNFIHIEAHYELLEKCSKFHTVMYSNTYLEEFEDKFDFIQTFSRINDMGNKCKSNKSKKEILAIKINERYLEHRPLDEILGISNKPIEEILNIPSNNQNYINTLKEVA